MFNIKFLHIIRDFEIKKIISFFPPNAKILEIGGGTGYQARKLTWLGFSVTSIDVASSVYREQQEFNVIEYDGQHIPFPDNTFDIVFSSNVLEHVLNLDMLHSESQRVLKPNGYCVHIMPSGCWRFWTNIAHYIEMLQKLFLICLTFIHSFKSIYRPQIYNLVRNIVSTSKRYIIVPRHGETGNAFTEIFTFSQHSWTKHFQKNNMIINKVSPMGLFYTGHMVLSTHLPVKLRMWLAKILGSACIVYKVSFPKN